MDDIQDAAPSSTEPVVDAAVAGSAMGERNTVSDAPASTGATSSDAAVSAEPSKDAKLMRMHAAFDELEAKIATGVHVFAHEVAALREHVKAVL